MLRKLRNIGAVIKLSRFDEDTIKDMACNGELSSSFTAKPRAENSDDLRNWDDIVPARPGPRSIRERWSSIFQSLRDI